MEVFKKTVSMVFGIERRYVIPLFQRPYVWKKEAQWAPLWDDILAAAEIELTASGSDASPHFLGAIVIKQAESLGDALLAHDVIDGQQRLTTFQILLSAFRDIAAVGDEKLVATSLTSWTRNANAMKDPEIEQFKLWPTSRDVPQFTLVMSAGSRAALEQVHPLIVKRRRPQPRPPMVEAYLFFYEAIDKWLREQGPTSIGERTKALRRVFDKRMQFVSIELQKDEDPQVIFETLNARGVPLLASDLLRNNIFQRAGKDADKLHEKYWSRFEVADDPLVPDGARFWEVEIRQGRLYRARLDLFVQHYLAMKKGNDVQTGRLFPEYKDWIRRAGFASLEDELRDFTTYASLFEKLLVPSSDTSVGRFAERLQALDNSTIYPLVLGLLGNPNLTAKERDGIFVDLESFLVRRLVCGRSTNTYNRLFLQFLRDFDAQAQPTRAAFQALLTAGTGESVDWPMDDAFKEAWMTLDAYREIKPVRVEMILLAINDAMTTAKTESITVNSKLSVEHVMPQKWAKHWPLPTHLDLETATERREDLIHDFGNLTVITQPLNSAVSNGPAAQKLPELAHFAALRLNAYFQSRTSWTEADILERGEKLFEHAKKIWPRP